MTTSTSSSSSALDSSSSASNTSLGLFLRDPRKEREGLSKTDKELHRIWDWLGDRGVHFGEGKGKDPIFTGKGADSWKLMLPIVEVIYVNHKKHHIAMRLRRKARTLGLYDAMEHLCRREEKDCIMTYHPYKHHYSADDSEEECIVEAGYDFADEAAYLKEYPDGKLLWRAPDIPVPTNLPEKMCSCKRKAKEELEAAAASKKQKEETA